MSFEKIDQEFEGQAQQLFESGLELLQLGRAEEADLLFAKAHQLNPNNVDTLNLLGIRSYQKQDYKSALLFLKSADVLAPGSPYTLSNLGLVHNAMLQFQEALEYCNMAIKKDGHIAETHNNHGNSLKGLGRYQDAIDAYKKATALRPNYAEALSNQGVIFLEQNMPEKAIQLFKQAISANPNLASAFNSLGNAFTQLGNSGDAFQSFERALQINPNYLDACLNFGNSLKKFKQYEGAIQCCQYALKMSPHHAKTFYLLGEVYYDKCNPALAKTYLAKCLSLDPSNIEAQYALAITQIPKIAESVDEERASRLSFANELTALQIRNGEAPDVEIASKLIARHPFYLAYQAENNEPLISQFGKICVEQAKPIRDALVTNDQKTKASNKIRIGIISHFFCEHPVWQAITKGWVTHLNPEVFEIHLFNTSGIEDGETELAKLKASSYVNCGSSTAIAGQIILDQNLDVVIYPEIGMDTTCKALACLRLAPIQAASWGHPETTGLTTIDFYLSGELLEPKTAKNHYSEELVKLPNFGTYFEQPPVNIANLNLSELGIDSSLPILLCPGSPAKYTPAHDQVLIGIAKRLAHCQFVFFNFEESLTGILKQRLRQAFSSAALSPDHFLRFIPFLKRDEFYGLMHKADLYLDTIGFSGFNTAMQAIICDLPVVTIEGNWMRGRLASAILRKLEVPELVCDTTQQYIDMTVELIQNPNLLQRHKANIALKKQNLFNDLTPIQALEQFLMAHMKIKPSQNFNSSVKPF